MILDVCGLGIVECLFSFCFLASIVAAGGVVSVVCSSCLF